jgi:hypothetical protein
MPKKPRFNPMLFVTAVLASLSPFSESRARAEVTPPQVTIAVGLAVARDRVDWFGHDGVTRSISSIDTVGNPFAFFLFAIKLPDGTVDGRMGLIDFARLKQITSCVSEMAVPHPVHGHPVGIAGGVSASVKSSTSGVWINGVERPGYRFANAPMYDSGQPLGAGDVVSFELVDESGVKIVLRWSAKVTGGNVTIGN